MAFASWIPLAASVVGGLLGGSSSGSGSTSQNLLDPRMSNYLYGGNGLISGANNIYQQQSAQGGLNPMQNAGLEMQRQTLTSPQYTQGFDAMRSLGLGLMGQGAAGNPFTGGGVVRGTYPMAAGMMQAGGAGGLVGPGHRGIQSFQGGMNPALAAAYQPIQQAQAAPQAAPTAAPLSQDDLMAMIQKLLQQQQDFRAGNGGGGAGGTGVGGGDTGSGVSAGDGGVGGI